MYKNYCSENHENLISNTKFGVNIKQFIYKVKSNGVNKYDLKTINVPI